MKLGSVVKAIWTNLTKKEVSFNRTSSNGEF